MSARDWWFAGCDKPHRCPACWSAQMRREPWVIRRWLPRRCEMCGALTLTTRLRGWYGVRACPSQSKRGDGS